MEAWKEELYSSELYHHGILGMKWGVRRYQNKDGSLTAAGKKRYGVGNAQQRTNDRIEGYKRIGYSQAEAEKAAKTRKIVTGILLGASAVTLAAAGAYVAKKHLPGLVDTTIKAGTKLQRIEMQDISSLHDKFYAAVGKHDKIKYAGQLGAVRRQQTGHAYKMDIGVDKDIKVAADRTARKIFMDLYNGDPLFRASMRQYANLNVQGGNAAKGSAKALYENFNSYLVLLHDNPEAQKWYDALSAKGYGAIRDVNDRKFSGYNAWKPLIIFDKGKTVVDSVSEMSVDQIKKNLNQSIINDILEDVGKKSVPGIIGGTIAYMAADPARSKEKNKTAKK